MKAFKSTSTKAATALDQPARRETLVDWQNKLLDRGYSPGSVNIHLSAANGLLEYMGGGTCSWWDSWMRCPRFSQS